MTLTAIIAPRIMSVDGILLDHAIVVDGGNIISICSTRDISDIADKFVYGSGVLVPGFIDVQVNGGGGELFNDNPSVEAIEVIAQAHRQFGTTGILPTLITDDLKKVETAVFAVDEAIRCGVPGVLGIHLEGPFLNPQKKGIHDETKMHDLTIELASSLPRLENGRTLITIAPEVATKDALLALVRSGAIVAAGHTNATYEELVNAISAGITGFTHLYNAMSPLEGRAPGAVGAALTHPNTWCGLIADGHHVHPASILTAIRAKGVNRCMLVTDAMSCVGSDLTEFCLNGETIIVNNGKCTNDAGVLAGSALDMISAICFTVETVGVELEEAIAMASSSPASFIRLNETRGSLSPAKKADIVRLSDEMEVKQVWVEGKLLVDQ